MNTVILAAAFLASGWGSSCSSGRCSDASFAPAWQAPVFAAPVQPVAAPVTTGYRWQSLRDTTDQLGLFKDGQQLGVWSLSRQQYAARLAPGEFSDWGAEPPVAPPGAGDKPKSEVADVVHTSSGKDVPTGVERDKISPVSQYRINGRVVSESTALQAVGGGNGTLEDDSARPFVTFFSPDETARQRFLSAWESGSLAGLRSKVRLHAYAPDAPMVAGLGWKLDGPTVYVQHADGRVAARLDNYQGDTNALAAAVRKADPSYDPSKDNGGGLMLPQLPSLQTALPYLLGLGCLFLTFLLFVLGFILILPRRQA